jgi:hypothetical protein
VQRAAQAIAEEPRGADGLSRQRGR